MKYALPILLHVVIVITMIQGASALCWGSGGYHVAAMAMAVGIGTIDSQAVCVYGSEKTLNDDECPLPCQSILSATWGDCYSRSPLYKPKALGSDNAIKSLSVYDMYRFLATPSKEAEHATCRTWLNENKDSWDVKEELRA
jgi:hypothetical protein